MRDPNRLDMSLNDGSHDWASEHKRAQAGYVLGSAHTLPLGDDCHPLPSHLQDLPSDLHNALPYAPWPST